MNLSLRRMAFSSLAIWIVVLALSLLFLTPLGKKLRFGIDLVGGTYITLEVQTDKAVEAALLDRLEDAVSKLKKAGKPQPVSKDIQKNKVVLTFNSVADAQAAIQFLKTERDIEFNASADTVTMEFSEIQSKKIKENAVLGNIDVLRTRLDKMSVAEISIAAQGEKNIVIELPNVTDPQHAKAMIGTAAILEFKLVEREGDSPEDIMYEYDGHLPNGTEILPGVREGDHQKYYLVSKRAAVTGKDLRDSRPHFADQRGEMVVGFSFTPDGGRKFYELTSKNYKKTLAVVLDGSVITAATIEAAISTDGSISRHGGYKPEEAKELALLLKSGSFVAPVTFEEERQVGPTLGKEAIAQGVLSCAIGLALLFVFSVFFYQVAGLLAFLTLIANLVFVLVGMVLLGATLTLPGIAGLVLTVGMAIDASILIYERIREELALGVPLKKAVHDGFSDAMRVILDANITTFIVGAVLYYFGTGPIQGFAVTMMLGIISTLLTGLFFLKSLFTFIIDNFNVQKIRI